MQIGVEIKKAPSCEGAFTIRESPLKQVFNPTRFSQTG